MTITKSDVEPGRIRGPPAKSKVLMSDMAMQNQGFVITKVEMCQYVERTDEKLGDYSLLIAIVHTDRGTVEMKYDEGFRGPDAFDSAVTMLLQYVGLSALINRALIALSE
ncbi:hypothetical protein NTE_02329 [Candidatus Nitrososphaera evergladensis SR1]|jgi:hypothetical protein|uniref:Uncharacterized protein n=1 Tax=Candidatus Nitrososphaera evergladensis SR1 TaxID=1459636 RepID=A0A075MUL5_9ARCH|nr:hypothetical protein [Candidatus Nitrososphaera evergladensis]AIF84382.1 hypothetical protein NTE_02329 [Candidatus Nitrososphaera evergladensis SR1]